MRVGAEYPAWIKWAPALKAGIGKGFLSNR